LIAIASRWEGDLSAGATGDIAVVPVQSEVQQRLIRGLLTNPGDYIWHTKYGAGLGSYVGERYSQNFIEGAVLNQLKFEPLVMATPAPSVQINLSLAGSLSTIAVAVKYQVSGTSSPDSVVLHLGTK